MRAASQALERTHTQRECMDKSWDIGGRIINGNNCEQPHPRWPVCFEAFESAQRRLPSTATASLLQYALRTMSKHAVEMRGCQTDEYTAVQWSQLLLLLRARLKRQLPLAS